MNTLTSPRVSSLLGRLYAEAKTADASLRAEFDALSKEQRDTLFSSAGGYRAFYHQARDRFLAVDPETGRLLYMLARSMRARSIVEFGTSFGLSTIHLAAAVRDNGGGRVIGSEFEASKAERARGYLAEAGLADVVEIREGDALETLARELPEAIDLVLLDGAKELYPEVLARLEPRLRPGALIVGDNADMAPAYLARVRETSAGYLSVPFAGDVELSMRLGP